VFTDNERVRAWAEEKSKLYLSLSNHLIHLDMDNVIENCKAITRLITYAAEARLPDTDEVPTDVLEAIRLLSELQGELLDKLAKRPLSQHS